MKNSKFLSVISKTVLLIGVGLLSSSASVADLVVKNSLCVGGDCPVTPAFGSDTIRLQENNLRIHFDDTSSTASFPSNDWRIIVNESSNGGANKFSINDATGSKTPFTVEAGARTNAFYVESDGDIGIGTNNPVVEAHLVRGDTPTVRLDQDGSSGFAPQAWDVAGNETNFFIRDVTNGSKLPFRIKPNAPTSSIYIAADGNVGLGDSSPDATLDIQRSNGTAKILVEETSATAARRQMLALKNNGGPSFSLIDTSPVTDLEWEFAILGNGAFSANLKDTTGSEFQIRTDGTVLMGPGSTTNLTLRPTGNLEIPNGDVIAGGVVLTGSSRSTKTDINPIDTKQVLASLNELQIAEWRYKRANKNDRHIGPMAEDFYSKFGLGVDNKHIAATDMAGVALAATKALNQRLEEKNAELIELRSESSLQNKELNELKTGNRMLLERLTSLEKLLTNLVAGEGILPDNGAKVVLNK